MRCIFICYPKCTTCQRARKWLDGHHVSYEIRDIQLQNPTKEELRLWQEKSGYPLNKLFNSSGIKYRTLKLSQRLKDMNEEEKLDLLASDGLLVKRPVLVTENRVLFGFRESEWEHIQ